MEHVRKLGHHEKTQPINHDLEGQKMQTEDIDNLVNRIIAENLPNLEKNRLLQVQETYRMPKHQNQKRNTPKHITIKLLSTQKKRKTSESCKREKTSHI
jgi:hypothetical protein